MKKMITSKWFLTALLTLVLCLSVFGMFAVNQSTTTQTVSANAQEQTVFKASELGIDGNTQFATYESFVTDSGATLESTDSGFVMGKGASVRVSRTTPGIRYTVNLGKGIDTIKAGETYGSEAYEYSFYVKFSVNYEGTTKAMYVKGDLKDNGENYYYTASLTFDNITEEQLNEYKALEVTGEGIMILTGASSKYVKADTNDNVRTMESVVNTGKLQNAFEDYEAETIAVMDSFVPCDEDTYILGKEDKIYAEKTTGITSIGLENVKTVYYNTAKISDGELTEAITFSDVEVGEKLEGYVTVVTNDGKFHNVPYFVADKVIREASDLTSLYNGENKIMGYFVVANDIEYDESVTIKPTFTNWGAGSQFNGTFDGDGHKIEYGAKQGGLFGNLNGTVKNVSIIVKSVRTETNATNTWTPDIGMYSIIAGYASDKAIVENVFAGYDCTFTPNLSKLVSQYGAVSTRYRGIGLFAASNGVTVKNTVVDMTKVEGVVASGDNTSYGVLEAPYGNSYWGGTLTNCYVIWGVKEMYYNNNAECSIATNEENYSNEAITCTISNYSSVNRFDNYADIKEYFTTNPDKLAVFEGIIDTSNGFPYAGDPLNLLPELGEVYYDGDTDDYEGDVAAVTKALDGLTYTKIVNIDDTTEVYYDGTTWTNIAQNLTNEKITLNALVMNDTTPVAKVNIVSVKKVITNAKDLHSVASHHTTVNASYAYTTVNIEGYYLVANDIEYDPNELLYPTHGWINAGSNFKGVFDGQGFRVEYGLRNSGEVKGGGLFGGTMSGTVKNVSIIVKSVAADGYGNNVILAGYITGTVENVYAEYDCEVTPNTAWNSEGIGWATRENGCTYKNVILNLSKVQAPTITIDLSVDKTQVLDIVAGNSNGSYAKPKSTNYNIIYADAEIYKYVKTYKDANTADFYEYWVAENDYDSYNTSFSYDGITVKEKVKLDGVYRYSTLAELNGQTVGNFKVENGVASWVE